MAVIRSLRRVSSDTHRHRTEVDATFQTVNDDQGLLFQISTYGSDERACEPKVSQTVQLDKAAAILLIQALRATFPDI